MKRRESGHAIIELAFSAAVMLACIAGTFQFGYTFFVYNQLLTAVGDGGRYAATRPFEPQDAEKSKQAIRNLVVYGEPQPEPGARPVVTGLAPENVDVDWKLDAGVPSAVAISIRGFSIDAIFARFLFDGRPNVEFPYVASAARSEK
jgi:hypothetical protein